VRTLNDLGDKALGMTRSVGVLDDHGNTSRCQVQMAGFHNARAKVATDGGRQAVSRGLVRMGVAGSET
jgi:hypothetical protein